MYESAELAALVASIEVVPKKRDPNALIAEQLEILKENLISPVAGVEKALSLSMLSLATALQSITSEREHADLVVAYHTQWVLLVNKFEHGYIDETMFLKAVSLLYPNRMRSLVGCSDALQNLIHKHLR